MIVSLSAPIVSLPLLRAEEVTIPAAADVGNKLCPVSGDPVSGQDFVEYQGKRYGLCCFGCKQIFLGNPSEYIAKMKVQESQAASSKEIGNNSHHHMEM